MFLLLFLFASAYADCTRPHPFILHCHAIDTFPNYDRQSDIVYIDIVNTTLKSLPLLTYENWPQLEFLTFKNNNLLPCSEIQKQIQDHIFYIDHDCTEPDKETKSTHQNKLLIIGSIIVIGIIIVSICAGFAIFIIQSKKSQGHYDCSFQSV